MFFRDKLFSISEYQEKLLTKLAVVFVVLFCFSSISNTVKSQNSGTISDSLRAALSEEELKEYRKKRLSIIVEVEGKERVNVTSNSTTTPGFFDDKTYTDEETEITRSLDKYKTWKVYRGFETITEPQFYNVAGYEDLHKKAVEYHTPEEVTRTREEYTDAENALRAVGLIGGIISAAGMLSKKPSVRKGAAIATGAGAGLYLIGMAIPQKKIKEKEKIYNHGKMLPASQVKGIAEDYNLHLLKKLTEESDK